MTLRLTRDQAYQRGFAASRKGGWFTDSLVADVESYFPTWRQEYPLSAQLDYRQEILKLWRERLQADLDLTKYPECRGLRELVHAEHEGYLAGCGGNEVQAAYHFNFYYFMRLRLATRYFGFPEELRGKYNPYATTAAECTAIYFADTPDGPCAGKNLDTSPNEKFTRLGPGHVPGGARPTAVRCVGGASAAVLCDDEPADIFPVNVDDITPPELDTVRTWAPFRQRYAQFCGPGNSVWVDRTGDAVAVENSNTLMGYRFAENGIAAVTALAYLTPTLKAHKAERDELSLQKRGWTHDSPDWCYWQGCNQRYDRLMHLVKEEAQRGPTLEGMANILLDPAGPLPQRISTANEPFYPGLDTNFWTMATWVTVLYGPQRRVYRWAHTPEPDGPIFLREPELVLEDDVPPQPEFEQQRQRLARIGKH